MIVAFSVGVEPGTAQEYYSMFQDNRLIGILRLDFPTLIQISLFGVTAFGIYAALRRSAPAYAALATAFVLVGITLALATHSAFSMVQLSDQYAAATSESLRDQLLAAGQAVIASDIWHSTAGFMAGIFMQGATVLISVVMLRVPLFSKWTAYAGILANGLDLLHVFVALFAPSFAVVLLYLAGPIYLLWFPLLARDLYRIGRGKASLDRMTVQEGIDLHWNLDSAQ